MLRAQGESMSQELRQAGYSAGKWTSPPSLVQPLQSLAGEPVAVAVAEGGPAVGFAAAGQSAAWRRSRGLVCRGRSQIA